MSEIQFSNLLIVSCSSLHDLASKVLSRAWSSAYPLTYMSFGMTSLMVATVDREESLLLHSYLVGH